MKAPSPFSKVPLFHIFVAALIVVAAVFLWREGTKARVQSSALPVDKVSTSGDPRPKTATTGAITAAPAPAAGKATAKTFDWFRLKPFAVKNEREAHQWTAEDGRDPDVIMTIAHNETEVQRLLEENDRIKRRQLVYRKEPAFLTVQKARAAGQPVQRLIIPALDGRELEVEVMNSDVASSGLSGTFAGRLPGRLQSMVTLAFKEGREAFTVISPEDKIFLQAHPREPGEIILTSFDPETYQPLPGGEPIKTAETLPSRK